MHSWRRLTCKEKGKKKMPDYGTDKDKSDQSESDTEKNVDGRSESKSESAKRALKLVNEKAYRSTLHKHPVLRYGYNEYMVHHYAYMMKVAKMREPESYVKGRELACYYGGRNAGT